MINIDGDLGKITIGTECASPCSGTPGFELVSTRGYTRKSAKRQKVRKQRRARERESRQANSRSLVKSRCQDS